MKRVQLSEIASVLEEVQKGETFEVLDGEKLVAKLSPAEEDPQKELKEHFDRMVAEGKARRGTGKLPDDFFMRPRPKIDGVLEELLRQRREGR